MFIKVFVPNSRGKIALTVEELEELLSDACEKAVREKCASCRSWYGTGVTYLNTNNEKEWDWTKVTCGSHQFSAETNTNTNSTISNKIDQTIGE